MAEVLGADPDQLDALAGRFERRAGELAGSRSALTAMLSRVPWVGADADRFRTTWRREQSRQLDLVVDDLRTMAADLRREAADQRATSGGAVGTTSAADPGPAGNPLGVATSPTGSPDDVAHAGVASVAPATRAARRVLAEAAGPRLDELAAGASVPAATGGLATAVDVAAPTPGAGRDADTLPGPVRDPDALRAELDRWWP